MVTKKATKKTKASTKKKTVAGKKKTASRKNGVRHVKLNFGPGVGQETSFNRADLIFTGIDHADMSYEVRVFLNNRKADDNTPRSPDSGYAGRFVVFGHGKCLGETGHCDAANAVRADYDPVRQHPVTPQRRVLTITKPLLRILSEPGMKLETITLVPISKNPSRKKRSLTAELFKYHSVTLETYR